MKGELKDTGQRLLTTRMHTRTFLLYDIHIHTG